jgi:hypothetical protein
VLECLPSKNEALNSNLSNAKKKKKTPQNQKTIELLHKNDVIKNYYEKQFI